MTKLREAMDNAMLPRGFSERTRESYLHGVRGIAAYYHRSPDQLSDAQVRDYLVYLLRKRNLSYSTCNLALNGIRFLFREVLKRPPEAVYLPGPRQPQRLPEILSCEEVGRIFAVAADLRHKTLLMTTYAAGLRVSEVCHLQVKHIDSDRMSIRVEQGKGAKDRYTLLSPRLLVQLRLYWRVYRPRDWLFVQRNGVDPLRTDSAQKIFYRAKRKAKIRKRCGFEQPRFNSCRNRSCPKCQTRQKEAWLAARRAELLPVEYFHLVFTLDHRINPLALGKLRLIYGLLFRCAADTLLAFAHNPKWLGATPGILMVLHTWGQKLDLHSHVHCIVTGGGLTQEGVWRATKPHFLFPVHALSRVFRGKFLDALTQVLTQGEVRLPDVKTEPTTIGPFIDDCKHQDWVVYAKSSFENSDAVLDYLSRYTQKTAISNERLIDQDNSRVRFRYRDYAHGNTTKVLGLEPEEFIRRFLLHILPKRFVRIRGYGLLANRDRRKHLQKARAALGQFEEMPSAPQLESVEAFMLRVAGIDIRLCPRCGKGRMCEVALLPPTRAPPAIGLPRTGSER